MDGQIEECVRGIDPPILFIPGVGAPHTAVILSEYGDFSKFKNSSKMLASAGPEPSCFQPGQFESAGHMVRHGSPYLRITIVRDSGQKNAIRNQFVMYGLGTWF